MKKEKALITLLLEGSDITINGNQPHDPHIKNDTFYSRALAQGSLGIGESYMEGWWDAPHLDEFFYKIFSANISDRFTNNFKLLLGVAKSMVINTSRRAKAFEVGQKHYDIGNDLYEYMLGDPMCYTCGYWNSAKNLHEAQIAKMDLICKKVGMKPGQRILDIGSGWGTFMAYAAEHYGVSAVGVTVSKEQKALADAKYNHLPIETRLMDYRDLDEQFDHIISIGMFEHVGYKNYRTYMEVAKRCLKDDGIFLLHTIGKNYHSRITDPWIDKYIFPNSLIPSEKQVITASEGLFVMEDWHNFGPDYDKTLMAWFANFDEHWDQLKSHYDERFYRMWKYYLLSCAGLFRSRQMQLWQIVYSKNGVLGGYKSVR